MKAMNFHLGDAPNIRLSLDSNQIASTREARGLALECLRGCVWITFENRREDHVLNPGERLPITVGGRLVVQGLVPSEVIFVRQLEAMAPNAKRKDKAWHPGECLRTFVTGLSSSRMSIDNPI